MSRGDVGHLLAAAAVWSSVRVLVVHHPAVAPFVAGAAVLLAVWRPLRRRLGRRQVKGPTP